MFWQSKTTIKQETTWIHDSPGMYMMSGSKCKPGCRYCKQKTVDVHHCRPAWVRISVLKSTDKPIISIIGAVHSSPVYIFFRVYDKVVFTIMVNRTPVYALGYGRKIHNKTIRWSELSTIYIWSDTLFAWFFKDRR